MKNPALQDYGTISPFIMVDDIDRQIDFLQSVLNAEVKGNLKNAEGISVHAEVIIGNSVIMLGRGNTSLPSQPSMNYVFVADVNSVFKKALELGAVSIYEPDDKFYGIREAGFKDFHNNTWFVAQYLKEISVEEIEKLLQKNTEFFMHRLCRNIHTKATPWRNRSTQNFHYS